MEHKKESIVINNICPVFAHFNPIKSKFIKFTPLKYQLDAICYWKPGKLVKIAAFLLVKKMLTEK
jgi:hypothetical protein